MNLEQNVCRNAPGVIAGAVVGSLAAVLLLVLAGFLFVRWLRRYKSSLEGRVGGRTDNELPQINQAGKVVKETAGSGDVEASDMSGERFT